MILAAHIWSSSHHQLLFWPPALQGSDLKHSLKEAHGENSPILSSEFTPPPHTQLVSNSITSCTQVTIAATGRHWDGLEILSVCQLEMLGFMCQNHGQVLSALSDSSRLSLSLSLYIYIYTMHFFCFNIRSKSGLYITSNASVSIQQHGKFDTSWKLCSQCYRKQLQSSFYQTSAVSIKIISSLELFVSSRINNAVVWEALREALRGERALNNNRSYYKITIPPTRATSNLSPVFFRNSILL